MTWLNSKIGGAWHQVKLAFERSDIGVAGAGNDDVFAENAIKPTSTRYAPIKDAVERRISMFLRRDLVSHLEIGFNEQFVLHYIEISADAQGRDVLDHFLREFSPEARIEWVKKLLGPAVQQHVAIDQFLGLDREFAVEDLAETDPFEEELNKVLTPGYRITLHGRWKVRQQQDSAPQDNAQQPAADYAAIAAPSAAEPSQLPARVAGPRLRLAIADAKSPDLGRGGATRVIEVDSFPAVLGSSAHADAAISGYYVSAIHCTLHWEEQRMWLEDHSTNGTWLDGRRVVRGVRVVVADGTLVCVGRGHGDQGFERYPQFRLNFSSPPLLAGTTRTPVAPPFRATPVAPEGGSPIFSSASLAIGRKAPVLASLAIMDATGNPRRDISKLPFTIGRGSIQDYVVPDANEGVSREHLIIEQIDQTGAVTLNLAAGKNGTFADGQALPERFVWTFGEEIVLAEKWTSAPVVRMCLRRVEH